MSLDYIVSYADTDAGGVVYHARYIEMAERSRNQLLSRAGFSIAGLEEHQNSLLVVHKIEATYTSPALLEDMLLIRCAVIKAGDVRSKWRTDVYRGDQRLCTIIAEIVCLTSDSRRLRSFPTELLHSVQLVNEIK
jgi:acyl-CoA thioester hydrolase